MGRTDVPENALFLLLNGATFPLRRQGVSRAAWLAEAVGILLFISDPCIVQLCLFLGIVKRVYIFITRKITADSGIELKYAFKTQLYQCFLMLPWTASSHIIF